MQLPYRGIAMPASAQLRYLSLRLDDEGKSVTAVFAPEGPTDGITLDALKRAVQAAGFGGYQLDELALQDATATYTAGESFELVVGAAVDGAFDISIDAARINAYLSCTRPLGGAPVTVEDVIAEAGKEAIAVDLDLEAVEHALENGGDDVLIARGKAPVAGVDGEFVNLIPSAKARIPHVDARGLADYHDLGELLVVHAGDPLMRLIPATDGEPGLNLSGQAIPAKAGKKVAFGKKLEGTAFHPEDENWLFAAIDGSPVVRADGVSVDPIYTVVDVNLQTGNIDFPGAVNVTGGVKSGMIVKASGDIHVEGTVEGGILIAGGDIVVKGGIIGLIDRPGEASRHSTTTCKGSCGAYFAQNARIAAGDEILIRDSVMQSELSAGRQVIIGEQGSRHGHLIGGVTRATMLVKARVIGSPGRSKTLVIVGADQALQERLNVIAESRRVAKNRLSRAVGLLDWTTSNPGGLPGTTVEAAEATRDMLDAELEALRLDEAEATTEIAAGKDARIVAEEEFLEGVELRFGSRAHQVTADAAGGAFHLRDGEVVFA
jgi:uncharacterized protein (DUF342 family)